MRWRPLYVAALACTAVSLTSCVSTPAGVSITSRAPQDTTAWDGEAKRAWIFIEGTQHGATPATVTIRRSFEITNLSLHVGSEFRQVRRYEFERTVTGSRRMMDFSFSGDFQGGYLTFTTHELSQDRRGRYVVPYYDNPIQVVDHEYDLVLIVQE